LPQAAPKKQNEETKRRRALGKASRKGEKVRKREKTT